MTATEIWMVEFVGGPLASTAFEHEGFPPDTLGVDDLGGALHQYHQYQLRDHDLLGRRAWYVHDPNASEEP